MSRILLCVQKPIGESCFYYLLSLKSLFIQIGGVVTNEGDDNWWKSNKIYTECVKNNIPVISNKARNIEKIINCIKQQQCNVIISIQHSWVLPEEVLRLVNYRSFNLHLAKLPEYKGYNTYSHAILNDEKAYSVTLHWMTAKVDQGDIVFEESFPIVEHDTAKDLYFKAEELGINLFKKLIDFLSKQQDIPRLSMIGQGKYYSRNSLNDLRKIQNPHDLSEIVCKSRAFFFPPYEPAYIQNGSRKIYLVPAES